MPATRRALIAGLGLIGGSIGLALRRRGWHVAYLDPFVDDARGAADERVTALDGDADLVIVATPVDVAMGLMARMGPMTTVCSVMAPFSREHVVAGHPLAGSEQSGIAAARADLFEGKPWFVDRDDPLVSQVVRDCGARLEVVDPAEHDRAVALTSHLPQLLSTALAAQLSDADLRFAGSGLKTFLRLAGSDASVWRSVFAANDENVRAQLGGVLRIAEQLLSGDDTPFARAKDIVTRLG